MTIVTAVVDMTTATVDTNLNTAETKDMEGKMTSGIITETGITTNPSTPKGTMTMEGIEDPQD